MTWESNLVPQAERRLRKRMDKSRILSILNINELVFEVKDDAKSRTKVTNLGDKQCTCGK